MKTHFRFVFLFVGLALLLHTTANAFAPKIDPIHFEIKTKAEQVNVDEEFEITISARLLNIPANAVYVFENSNAFRIKLVMPEGFRQTGGTYSDFEGAELSPSKPSVTYTVKGKFTISSPSGVFQLLRGHKNATSQSNFVEVGRLAFKVDQVANSGIAQENARINMDVEPSYIPYLSISSLRSGAADTASVVFVTDQPREGIFKYNPSSNAADDGSMVIKTSSGRRYERVYTESVNVKWFGIVPDGSTDHTAALQALLNNAKYSTLFFPYGSSSYRIRSIKIPSNKTLLFEDNTVIEGTGTLGTYDPMVYIIAVSNIVIKGKNVTFWDHREKYTTGQQRHIFLMQGVKNVIIDGIAANSSGGDGFYIGATSVIKHSENVTLSNITADNNRRQGLSIISGKNILVENGVFSNTNGENPGAGIDIEPNTNDNILENIRIINVTTRSNKGPGIIISPWALSGSGRAIDIVISNHVDEGSFYGLLTSTVKSALPGTVTINNPIWKNSWGCAFVSRNWSHRGPEVQVINPTVIDANTGGSTSPNLGAAFLIYKAQNDTGSDNIGNIHIFNPAIQDNRATKLITSSFCYRDLAAGSKIVNCSLMDPIMTQASLPNRYVVVHNTELIMSDKHRYLVTDFGNLTRYVSYVHYATLYHNETSRAARILKLEKVNTNFPEVTVEVRAPYPVQILPLGTENILPLSTVNGKHITSKTVGSRIVLRKTADNSWHIKEMVGTWTVQP